MATDYAERGRRVEKSHSQAKHKARWRKRERDRSVKDDDEIAAWRKDYYRNARPDIDPQSTASKVMEFVGLDDDPYARDARSYDYRQEAWNESLARGDPDLSFMLPELSDENVREVGGAIERTLGVFNPSIYTEGYTPAQRPSTDERVLAQLTPEDRAAVAQMDPDQADAALKEMFPDWSPKMNPFPTSMMGTREREGDARIGGLPHFLDQFNYSPYLTEDIFSFLGPDSPETIRRDIDAWKGGSSSLDRTIEDAVGGSRHFNAESEQPHTQNPFVDPVEYGALGIALGVPGMIGSAVRGGKKAVGIGKKVVGAIKKPKPLPKPGMPPTRGTDIDPSWPKRKPRKPIGTDDDPGRYTNAAGGSVRSDIRRAIARNQPTRANDAAIATALVPAGAATGGIMYAAEAEKRRKKGY